MNFSFQLFYSFAVDLLNLLKSTMPGNFWVPSGTGPVCIAHPGLDTILLRHWTDVDETLHKRAYSERVERGLTSHSDETEPTAYWLSV